MMQFIVTDLLMLSVGTMLLLAARTLPRLEESANPEKKGFLDQWLASDLPEKIDLVVNQFLVKFLRKLKVILLRVDNTLSTHLKKIKPETPAANGVRPAIDLKEI